MGRSQDYNRSRRTSPAPPSTSHPSTIKVAPARQHTPPPDVPEIVVSGVSRPDVIVYSLKGKEAYSSLGNSYDEAIDLLYSVYPRELASVPRDCIEFSIAAASGSSSHSRHVVVSDSAWSFITTGLPPCSLIYVTVVNPVDEAGIAPPRYDESDSRMVYEKKPSPTLSPVPSRPGSPNRRSPSPPGHQSLVNKAKGIFGLYKD